MDQDLYLGFCIVKVLCLIVIAMSLHRLAYPREYFGNAEELGKAGLPHLAERTDKFIGSGANEAPVFWNIGDLEAVSSGLHEASAAPAESENFTVASIKSLDHIEALAGKGY